MSNLVYEVEVKFEWGFGWVSGNKIVGKLFYKKIFFNFLVF